MAASIVVQPIISPLMGCSRASMPSSSHRVVSGKLCRQRQPQQTCKVTCAFATMPSPTPTPTHTREAEANDGRSRGHTRHSSGTTAGQPRSHLETPDLRMHESNWQGAADRPIDRGAGPMATMRGLARTAIGSVDSLVISGTSPMAESCFAGWLVGSSCGISVLDLPGFNLLAGCLAARGRGSFLRNQGCQPAVAARSEPSHVCCCAVGACSLPSRYSGSSSRNLTPPATTAARSVPATRRQSPDEAAVICHPPYSSVHGASIVRCPARPCVADGVRPSRDPGPTMVQWPCHAGG